MVEKRSTRWDDGGGGGGGGGGCRCGGGRLVRQHQHQKSLLPASSESLKSRVAKTKKGINGTSIGRD